MTGEQLSLPFSRDGRSLNLLLSEATGKKVSVVLTDNTSSMISFRAGQTGVAVRLHRMFLCAEDDVMDELARFIAGKRRRTPLIRRFIKRNRQVIASLPPRRQVLRPFGKSCNLAEISRQVNKEYFQGEMDVGITWGTSRKTRARQRTLGSYSRRTNVIRINPVLDKRQVPRYFIAFVVYHEMLHAHLGVPEVNGRRQVHSREFKRRERLFTDYEQAVTWEKSNL
jgi:predicted SprT family Zn-dependent metalloprotease